MKRIFKFLLIIVICIFSFKVYAEDCDSADIKRLKKLASFVEFNYEYNYDGSYNTYTLNIQNVTDELILEDTADNQCYLYDDNNKGVFNFEKVRSGTYNYIIYSSKCDVLLKRVSLKLKRYNIYHNYPECENSDLDVCKEFYDTSDLDVDEFYEIVGKNDDTETEKSIFDKILSNKIICGIIVGVIIVLIIVIVMVIRKKKGRLE